jgi:hypothetical protein
MLTRGTMKLRRTRKLAILAALTCLVLALTAAAASAATSKKCTRDGDRVTQLQDRVVYILRPVRNLPPWETGSADRHYVCSREHGKRVFLGIYGVSTDGTLGISRTAANRDYFAYVAAGGGNAGGAYDFAVRVIDLQSGEQVTKAPVAQDPVGPVTVRTLLLNRDGWVAWSIEQRDGYFANPFGEVYENNRQVTRRLATGRLVDPTFLRFGPGNRSLVWADSVGLSTVVPITTRKAAVNHRGSCLRKGEKNVSKKPGIVLVRRRFDHEGWKKGGYFLMACSGSYRKRVEIGMFGNHFYGKKTISLANIDSSSRFVAIARRTAEVGKSVTRDLIQVFDLATGDVVTQIFPEPDTLPDGTPIEVAVTALRVDKYGDVAWITRQGRRDATGALRHVVHYSDANGPRVLDHGFGVDSTFLRFGTFPDPEYLRWSSDTGRGQAQ